MPEKVKESCQKQAPTAQIPPLPQSVAFVQGISQMPSWLQTFVAWNPISATVQAVRSAFGNTGIAPTADFWPLKHANLVSVAWSLLLVVVFGTMAIRRYRTASRR